jgi:hypothetical protein
VNTVLPTVSGGWQQGSLLSASNGNWSYSPTGYAYHWRRCDSAGANCASIGGATSSSYTLISADVGKRLRVVVTASNSGGSASATSAATPTVSPAPALPPPPPVNNEAPVISGVEEENRTLTASTGSWSNSPTGYGYQWRRCDAAGDDCRSIPGATSASYTLGASDVGRTLRVVVTAWNAEGFDRAKSRRTSVIAPAPGTLPLPGNVRPPEVEGKPVVGRKLQTSGGSWTNAPTRFTYQWRRCTEGPQTCTDIAAATGSQYIVSRQDVGSWLAVRVTAWNRLGSSSASSAESRDVRVRP